MFIRIMIAINFQFVTQSFPCIIKSNVNNYFLFSIILTIKYIIYIHFKYQFLAFQNSYHKIKGLLNIIQLANFKPFGYKPVRKVTLHFTTFARQPTQKFNYTYSDTEELYLRFTLSVSLSLLNNLHFNFNINSLWHSQRKINYLNRPYLASLKDNPNQKIKLKEN